MPMLDFECTVCGDRWEEFRHPSQVDDEAWHTPEDEEVRCGGPGTRIYSTPGELRPTNAMRFEVHVYEAADGKVHPCGSSTSPIPAGAKRMVISDIYSLRKIENRMNAQDQEVADKFRNARQTLTDGQLKENRRVMESLVANFTPRGKKFYEAMRRVSEQRQQLGPKQTRPAAFFEAFSMDSSNREGYYNERIEYGSHKGHR